MAITYRAESYCGTALVKFIGQTSYNQLTGVLNPATLNNYVQGTLIPSAERMIDDFVGRREGTLRHFNAHGSLSWLLDGSGKTAIFFPPRYCPPIYIGNVNIDGASTGASSPTQIKMHEQYVDYDNSRFRKGHLNIEFFGTYGYIYVPKDIEYMTAQLCANVLNDVVRRRASDGAVSTDFATIATSLFGSPQVFTDEMRKRLKTYRIKWVDVG